MVRDVAGVVRSYAMAVLVNVAIASAAPREVEPAGRPPIVRWIEGPRTRFDRRELGGPGTVLTVPLTVDGGGGARSDEFGDTANRGMVIARRPVPHGRG